MTNEELVQEVQLLKDKEAIRDQLYTYCHALDRIDHELGYSVFAEDSHVNYGPNFPSGTGREFFDFVLGKQHMKMISTHHIMTNVLIKVDGDRAVSETYMFAACKYPRKNGGSYTVEARCRDIDRWVKRDGKWLIIDRVAAGDNTRMMFPTQDLENYNTHRMDKKDHIQDHSYTVFSEIK